MNATKPTCRGAGQSVALAAPPSSLVTCLVCGRRNLGALDVREHYSEVFGYFRGGDVPPHTPAPPSAADAVRATAASKEWER